MIDRHTRAGIGALDDKTGGVHVDNTVRTDAEATVTFEGFFQRVSVPAASGEFLKFAFEIFFGVGREGS